MNVKSRIIHLEKIDSTNRYALANFAELPDTALILSKEQSSGRGRHGKKWISPPGNIYASFVIKKNMYPAQFTFIGALSSLQTLREYVPFLPFWLKWPNDIYTKSLKISGILCETHNSVKSNRPDGAVIGIGINLNIDKDFFETNKLHGTSILAETGKITDIGGFAESLQNNLCTCYMETLENPDRIFKDWKKENLLIGREIEIVLYSDQRIRGVFKDVGEDGSLMLLMPDGEIRKFHSGEVSVRQ